MFQSAAQTTTAAISVPSNSDQSTLSGWQILSLTWPSDSPTWQMEGLQLSQSQQLLTGNFTKHPIGFSPIGPDYPITVGVLFNYEEVLYLGFVLTMTQDDDQYYYLFVAAYNDMFFPVLLGRIFRLPDILQDVEDILSKIGILIGGGGQADEGSWVAQAQSGGLVYEEDDQTPVYHFFQR